jgi:hypothetical protein
MTFDIHTSVYYYNNGHFRTVHRAYNDQSRKQTKPVKGNLGLLPLTAELLESYHTREVFKSL